MQIPIQIQILVRHKHEAGEIEGGGVIGIAEENATTRLKYILSTPLTPKPVIFGYQHSGVRIKLALPGNS